MAYDLKNIAGRKVILGISGGVDSAVAAVLLQDAGAKVQALHMTNWEDEDGYCTAADDLQDARRVCEQLRIPLHHVNFARQYRDRVFSYFLDEYRAGRTPNPDYARTASIDGVPALLKGADADKDQSYFLHAVSAEAISETVFPLGELHKSEVRQIARDRGLAVHDKKDSTGICFIGERPFREFLSTYLPANPGPIRTTDGREVGKHHGLMYYTLGQRQGLGIGGRRESADEPWYVVDKNVATNTLVVDQGDSPLLLSRALIVRDATWIGDAPNEITKGFHCCARIRYRQPDQVCHVSRTIDDGLMLQFGKPQRAAAPGQFVVFYQGDRCLGGGVIDTVEAAETAARPPLEATFS
jgi:tRNA-specific 2-thiouridylase